MKRATALATIVGLAVAACGQDRVPAEGHVLFYVDTDAPVPPAPGIAVTPLTPPPLFDSLQVDLYPSGASLPCADCTRIFSVDASLQASGLSFAVVPQSPGMPVVAHVTLYREISASVHGIDPDTTLQAWVRLPTAPATGEVVASVFLPTAGVGTPAGSLTAPTTPGRSALQPARFGSWAPSTRTPCAGAAPPGMVCVPGGAFWMGGGLLETGGEVEPVQRIVTLSPFFLGAHEVTVAEARQGGIAPSAIGTWSGALAGTSPNDWCTYTASSGPHEALPANCVTWAGARAYCQAMGGDLPTEAQLEYVMSGLASNPFPWGQEAPACADAVWGQGAVFLGPGTVAQCMPASDAGATPEQAIGYPGAGAPPDAGRDVLALPGGSIVELAGNVSEWALDWLQTPDESCWSAPQVYADPMCATPTKTISPAPRVVKGGSFVDDDTGLVSFLRQGAPPSQPKPVVGFRCAVGAGM